MCLNVCRINVYVIFCVHSACYLFGYLESVHLCLSPNVWNSQPLFLHYFFLFSWTPNMLDHLTCFPFWKKFPPSILYTMGNFYCSIFKYSYSVLCSEFISDILFFVLKFPSGSFYYIYFSARIEYPFIFYRTLWELLKQLIFKNFLKMSGARDIVQLV